MAGLKTLEANEVSIKPNTFGRSAKKEPLTRNTPASNGKWEAAGSRRSRAKSIGADLEGGAEGEPRRLEGGKRSGIVSHFG